DTEREEDTVPSTTYVTQLYYKISRIDWDYEAEPSHYGPDIAQPIDIDGSRHSRCFVSDYLWRPGRCAGTAWAPRRSRCPSPPRNARCC
uniref:Uncharacterized protein n=1 Tax=Aquila chrysaetos chrysaetos TaxID=223781 RepID=A0A663F6A8_AQUCH